MCGSYISSTCIFPKWMWIKPSRKISQLHRLEFKTNKKQNKSFRLHTPTAMNGGHSGYCPNFYVRRTPSHGQTKQTGRRTRRKKSATWMMTDTQLRTDRHTDEDRHTEGRQTHKWGQTDGHRDEDRHTDQGKQAERHTDQNKQTDTKLRTDGHTDQGKQTNWQAHRETHRSGQTDQLTERQRDI